MGSRLVGSDSNGFLSVGQNHVVLIYIERYQRATTLLSDVPKLFPTFWGEPLGGYNFFGHSFRLYLNEALS
jgi:hypothetical protein